MMPSCVSFSVMMSNISVPSPSIIRYSTSAFFPVSASVAFTLPMAVPTGEDSRTRRWMVSAKHIEKGEKGREGEKERFLNRIFKGKLHMRKHYKS